MFKHRTALYLLCWCGLNLNGFVVSKSSVKIPSNIVYCNGLSTRYRLEWYHIYHITCSSSPVRGVRDEPMSHSPHCSPFVWQSGMNLLCWNSVFFSEWLFRSRETTVKSPEHRETYKHINDRTRTYAGALSGQSPKNNKLVTVTIIISLLLLEACQ